MRHEIAMARSRLDRAVIALAKTLRLPRNREWRRLLEMTDSQTMVDRLRRANLLRLIGRLERDFIAGTFVECGVARGGVAALIASRGQESRFRRDTWLFDSFAGVPEPTLKDGTAAIQLAGNRAEGRLLPIGEFVGTLQDVKAFLFGRCQLSEERVHLVQGWFQDTLWAYRGGPIALLHVDSDWYESVRVCLEALWPHVAPGGFVVLDDYGHWEGARRATREFLARQPHPIRLHRKGYTQAFLQKTAHADARERPGSNVGR